MKRMLKVSSAVLSLIIAVTALSFSVSALATEITAGSSKATAKNIPQYGVEYVSSLSKANEIDWFKFTTVSDDAYYFINLENYSLPSGGVYYSPNLYLYDEYMRELAHINNTSETCIKLENNTTYYIKILMGIHESDGTGNYEILVEYKYDVEPNTKDLAKTFPVNNKQVCSMDGWGDTDWFKITTSVAGDYTFKLENHDLPNHTDSGTGNGLFRINIYVYDMFDKELKHSNNNTTFTLTLEANTTYYIKLLMGSNEYDAIGTYSLTVSSDAASQPSTKTLSSIKISSLPSKTVYNIGESFNKSGLTVKANYSDGTSANVTGYTLSGFSSSASGEKTITVSYSEGGKTASATFKVTVKAEDNKDPEPDPGYQVDKNNKLEEIKTAFINFFNKIQNFFNQIIAWIMGIFTK